MSEAIASPETRTKAAEQLADRYLALWNEADPERRRRMIAELWTEDGRHFLQPPQEIRGIAAQPGIGLTAILEARGYEEIEARVASAYEHWVGSEGPQLPGARRRRATRRRRQVPLGGRLAGRRGDGGGARRSRPRRGRPDRARLHVRRELGVREPGHSGVSREARANALPALWPPSPRHRSTTLPWRLTMYPTVHMFGKCDAIATAEA